MLPPHVFMDSQHFREQKRYRVHGGVESGTKKTGLKRGISLGADGALRPWSRPLLIGPPHGSFQNNECVFLPEKLQA